MDSKVDIPIPLVAEECEKILSDTSTCSPNNVNVLNILSTPDEVAIMMCNLGVTSYDMRKGV